MTCPLCGSVRYIRERFFENGGRRWPQHALSFLGIVAPRSHRTEPSTAVLLSRCASCGLKRFHAVTGSSWPAVQIHRERAPNVLHLDEQEDPIASLQAARTELGSDGTLQVMASVRPEPMRQRFVFDHKTLRATLERGGFSVKQLNEASLFSGQLVALAQPK